MTTLPSGQTPERWSFKSELPWGLGAAQPSPLSPRPCGFNPDFSLSWVPGVCGAPNSLLLPAPTSVMAHISNLLPDVTRASFLPWGDVHSTSCRNHGASNETTNLSSLPSKGHCVPPCRPSETQASLTASPNSSCGRPEGVISGVLPVLGASLPCAPRIPPQGGNASEVQFLGDGM